MHKNRVIYAFFDDKSNKDIFRNIGTLNFGIGPAKGQKWPKFKIIAKCMKKWSYMQFLMLNRTRTISEIKQL